MIDRMKTCRELHDVKIANQSGSMVSNIIAWAVYGVPDSHWHFELPAIVPPRSEMRAGERYLESRGAGYSILAQPTSCHHHLSTNFDNSIYYCTFEWLYVSSPVSVSTSTSAPFPAIRIYSDAAATLIRKVSFLSASVTEKPTSESTFA